MGKDSEKDLTKRVEKLEKLAAEGKKIMLSMHGYMKRVRNSVDSGTTAEDAIARSGSVPTTEDNVVDDPPAE